jgi:Tfp pilus assembly protein PilZ
VDERRAHQRFACDLRARVGVHDGRECEGWAVDISAGGICIYLDQPIEPRSAVEVHIWAVLPERDSSQITMPGKIAWCTPVEGRIQLGVTFENTMDNRAVARLDVLLQFLAGNLGSDRM